MVPSDFCESLWIWSYSPFNMRKMAISQLGNMSKLLSCEMANLWLSNSKLRSKPRILPTQCGSYFEWLQYLPILSAITQSRILRKAIESIKVESQTRFQSTYCHYCNTTSWRDCKALKWREYCMVWLSALPISEYFHAIIRQ